MRTAALFAFYPARNHARGQLEQEAELQRLGEIAVEDVALVLDGHALVALAQAFDDLPLLAHLRLTAEDSEVLVHRLGELVPDRPGPLSLTPVEQLLQLALGISLDGRRNLDRRVGERPVGSVATDPLSVRDRFHQRVAAQAVRAVNGDARAFAGSVETLDFRQPPDIGVDATHVVVRSGPDGNRLVDRVDPGEGHRELARAVQALQDLLRAEMAQVEDDVAVDSSPFVDLRLLGA